MQEPAHGGGNNACTFGSVQERRRCRRLRRLLRSHACSWAWWWQLRRLVLLQGSGAQQLPQDAEEGLVNACKNLGMAVAASAEAVADPVAALHRPQPLLGLQVAALATLLAWRKDVLVRALQVRLFGEENVRATLMQSSQLVHSSAKHHPSWQLHRLLALQGEALASLLILSLHMQPTCVMSSLFPCIAEATAVSAAFMDVCLQDILREPTAWQYLLQPFH